MQAALESSRTGCVVGDRLIVLDRISSRYLLVADHQTHSATSHSPHDHQSVVLSWSCERPLRRDTARERWVTSARREMDPTDCAASTAALLRLWLSERRAIARLRRGLAAGLKILENVSLGDPSPHARAALIGAAAVSRLLWSSQDRCLPRAIALTCSLRSVGSAADLVLGVTAEPFAAHAWVQEGDLVLNDTLDHVSLFTPILRA